MDWDNITNIGLWSSYIKSFGLLAPLVAFGLFAVQAALPILPYMVLATVGGLLFGYKLGFVLAWLGALCGACTAYVICKWLAFDWASAKLQDRFGYDISRTNSTIAFWSIVAARIIPVVPTPLINAAAAVSGVSFWNFFFSSALGKIPTALLYSSLGHFIYKYRIDDDDITMALAVVGVLLLLLVIGKKYGKQLIKLPF